MDKILAIVFSLLMLGESVVIRRAVGTWLFPACLFSLFWFLVTFLPLVALWWIPVEPLSVAYILVCTIAFSLGAVQLDWRRAFELNRAHAERRVDTHDSGFIKLAFYVLSAAVVACIAIDTVLQGFSLGAFVSNLMESSAEYAGKRYSEDLTRNVFGQLGVVLTYVAVILGGLLFPYEKRPLARWTVTLVAFVPSALVMVMQSAKGTLLLAIVLFYGAALIARIRRNELVLVRGGSLPRRLLLGGGLAALIVTSFMSRGLYESSDSSFVLDRLRYYVASYTSGHMYAFSDWFTHLLGKRSVNSYAAYERTYGFYTFMSAFKLFGSSRTVPPGVYDEYFTFQDIVSSNIYTIFRGLIMDFGLIGSAIYTFVTGLLSHAAFYVLLAARRPVVSLVTYVFMLGYIYTTFIISIFIWNSIFASFALTCVLLYVNEALSASSSRDTVLSAEA